MTKKSKMILGLASMLGVSAGATAVSGFAWFITTKSATVDITNIGVYSTSSGLDVQLKTIHQGLTVNDSPATAHNIDLLGATESKTETILATEANQTTFNLQKYASAITSVKVGENEPTDAYTHTAGTKVVTLTSGAGIVVGTPVVIQYSAYAALTDISSTDGQTFYKPTWTAGNPGLYATAMPTTTSGYVSFTMTLTASGNDALDIYLNGASISAAVDGAANTAAANIARVAFIENTTTNLIIQNTVVNTNNKGIDSSFVANSDVADRVNGNNCTQWDLSKLATTPAKLAAIDHSVKDTWSTGAKTTAQNYVCTVNGQSSVDIKVAIWLEGTSGNSTNNASGQFSGEIENAMISVNLPLIAFNAVA